MAYDVNDLSQSCSLRECLHSSINLPYAYIFSNTDYLKQSFVDLQFPNGQLTYVSGEGLTTSVFVPLCGGLLQAQGQYPGDMRFSFSFKVRFNNTLLIYSHSFTSSRS